MAESQVTLREHRPRSILKRSEAKKATTLQWNEENIKQTFHPENKDYGHMKIEEPKTPYRHDSDDETTIGDEKGNTLITDYAKILTDKVENNPTSFVYREPPPSSIDLDDSDDDEQLSQQDRARKNAFKVKRSKHYNEGLFLKKAKELARKSLDMEVEDYDDDDDTKPTNNLSDGSKPKIEEFTV